MRGDALVGQLGGGSEDLRQALERAADEAASLGAARIGVAALDE